MDEKDLRETCKILLDESKRHARALRVLEIVEADAAIVTPNHVNGMNQAERKLHERACRAGEILRLAKEGVSDV